MSEPAWVPLGAGATTFPPGSLIAYAGAATPAGFLLCDGSAVSRTDYAALFAAIGVAYGAGDGSLTFNLPDLRGRVAVGKGTHANVDTLGDNDGSALADRQPAHRHTVSDPTHQHYITGTGGGPSFRRIDTTTSVGGTSGSPGPTTNASGLSAGMPTGITINAAGATAPLDTPAYVVLNYIIKT